MRSRSYSPGGYRYKSRSKDAQNDVRVNADSGEEWETFILHRLIPHTYSYFNISVGMSLHTRCAVWFSKSGRNKASRSADVDDAEDGIGRRIFCVIILLHCFCSADCIISKRLLQKHRFLYCSQSSIVSPHQNKRLEPAAPYHGDHHDGKQLHLKKEMKKVKADAED